MVTLAPLSSLPFVYTVSYCFQRELSAVLFLLAYMILLMWQVPFIIVPMRLNAKTESMGDSVFRLMKMVPLESIGSSIIYNGEVLS